MQKELEERVTQAAAKCKAYIERRLPFHQQPPSLSVMALHEHGPQVIADLILQVVADLTGSCSLPAARTDKYWKAFFSGFIQVKRVTYVINDMDVYLYPKASPFFEAHQRPYMRTTLGAGLQIVGYVFKRPSLANVGREDGWQIHGFQLFHDELLGTFSDPTPLQYEATVMVARLLAYCVSMLETVSVLEQLEPVRQLLNALNTGCVPVAYDKTTGTLFLKNWR